MSDKLTIAIDFDGTCVSHAYPEIGKDIGSVPILKQLVEKGHSLILYTMRSDKELDEAISWFQENNIPLYGIQTNPTQHLWTQSNKCYANIYIDDAALGCPLVYDMSISSDRAFVDWEEVEILLKEQKVL